MELLGLDKFELIWERAEDTKVLLAWGRSRLVIAFRGTASLRNVLADLQVLLPRESHRPEDLCDDWHV
jgi:hypothetical protein